MVLGVRTDDLLDSLATRIAKRYALSGESARAVVELFQREVMTKNADDRVSLMMLIRIAKSGINFGRPLTRRSRKGDGDEEC